MNIEERYWCHICNQTSPIYISNEIKKCQNCNSEFIELIEYPNYNRFSSLRIVLNEGENMPDNQLIALIEMLRSIEDRNIMELREMSHVEHISHQTFEEDHNVEKITPISKEYFSKLIEVILSNEDIKKECSICQTTFEKELKGLKLECNHIFHKDCILGWFKQKNTCPICRSEFLTEQ